jgi:hypothetical protein
MFDPQTALSHISMLLTLCLRLFARAPGRAPLALTRLARAIRATAAEMGIAAPDLDDTALIAWFNAALIAPAASARGGPKKVVCDKSEDGRSGFGPMDACMRFWPVVITPIVDGRPLRPRAWPARAPP